MKNTFRMALTAITLTSIAIASVSLTSCSKEEKAKLYLTVPEYVYEGTYAGIVIPTTQDVAVQYNKDYIDLKDVMKNESTTCYSFRAMPLQESITDVSSEVTVTYGPTTLSAWINIRAWKIAMFDSEGKAVAGLWDGKNYTVKVLDAKTGELVPLTFKFTVSTNAYQEGTLTTTKNTASFTASASTGRPALISATFETVEDNLVKLASFPVNK